MRRVVATGLSVFSSAGTTIAEFWNNLVNAGKDIAEPVVQFPLPNLINPNVARRMDQYGIMAVSSTMLAIADSHLLDASPNMERVGTIFSSTFGALPTNIQFLSKLFTAGPDLTSPIVFANTVFNAGLGHTCVQLGLKGASTMLMGSSSVGHSLDLLRDNRADALLAGGFSEYFQGVEDAYRKLGFTDDECQGAVTSRPFDARRNGIKPRGGAAVIVLEDAEHAFQRDARILAEIIGYGGACSHTSPERAMEPIESRPFADAMQAAMADAGISPDEVDAIICAASGSRGGDLAEAQAIHSVFGSRGGTVPVTSNKGLTGEPCGAGPTMGVAVGILAMANQVIPPTAGHTVPDAKIGLNVVTGEALRGSFRTILVNGADVGGNLASIVLRRF